MNLKIALIKVSSSVLLFIGIVLLLMCCGTDESLPTGLWLVYTLGLFACGLASLAGAYWLYRSLEP